MLKSFMIYCVILFFCLSATDNAEPITSNTNLQINNQEVTFKLNEDVLLEIDRKTSRDSRIEYLLSIIQNNINNSKEANSRKASAIQILGSMKEPKAIKHLIENIDFGDVTYRSYPAVQALAEIGDIVVDDLLEFISIEEDKKKLALAVQSLMKIKGSKYNAFVESKKDQVSLNTFKCLLRYAIED